jgi:hypothetical protein
MLELELLESGSKGHPCQKRAPHAAGNLFRTTTGKENLMTVAQLSGTPCDGLGSLSSAEPGAFLI